jgi:hypothetical protein
MDDGSYRIIEQSKRIRIRIFTYSKKSDDNQKIIGFDECIKIGITD